MSVSNAITVGFEGYQQLLSLTSPETVICVRGRHAIGKSEGVYQAASKRRSDLYKDPEFCARMIKMLGDPAFGGVRRADALGNTVWTKEWNYDMGIPVVERRLSQMTEGDLLGMPFLGELDGQSATQFTPCDWLIHACHFPTVLFLDERNRALDAVKQSIFQLADSRVFYGNHIHPETTIVVSENIGEAYQVQQQDPAEISRWVTVNLDPSREEFYAFAEKHLHEAVLGFLRSNPSSLEYIGVYEPDKKYPDRRSWMKFNAECIRLGILDEDNPPMILRILAGGYLGVETGVHFFKYCQERERQIRVDDVLKDWKKVKNRLQQAGPISAEKYVEIVHKIGDWLKDVKESPDTAKNEDKKNAPCARTMTLEQAKELSKFMHDCPAEPRITMWAVLQRDMANLLMIHPFVDKLIVATATGGDVSQYQDTDVDLDVDTETQSTVATANASTSKRGRK